MEKPLKSKEKLEEIQLFWDFVISMDPGMLHGRGGSSMVSPKRSHLQEQPEIFGKLMEKITSVLIEYIKMQFEAGVDALQIFDSWHSLCPQERAWEWSLKWIKSIIKQVPKELSIILYAKTPDDRFKLLASTDVDGLSIDQRHDLAKVRATLPAPLTLQGNLAPDS